MSNHEETNPHFWSDFSAPPLVPPEPRQPWDGHLYHPGHIQQPDHAHVTPRPRQREPHQPSPVVPRSRSRAGHDGHFQPPTTQYDPSEVGSGHFQQPEQIQLTPRSRQPHRHQPSPVALGPRSPTEYSYQPPTSPPPRHHGGVRPTQYVPPKTPMSSQGSHKSKPKPSQHPRPHVRFEPEYDRPLHPRDNLMYPPPNKTRPLTWFGAVFCVILWLAIILGGLLVFIIYLLYRPRTPHFEISSATLNAVYLDMGYLLNSDVTMLANFTNPNNKVYVDFSYVILKLYYDKYLIANQYIEPFSAYNRESKLANVEFVTSQVRLPLQATQQLITQVQRNRVTFQVDGIFHARSNFGSLLRYSYWLYGHCQIEMTGPPSGVLLSSHCRTKD